MPSLRSDSRLGRLREKEDVTGQRIDGAGKVPPSRMERAYEDMRTERVL